MSYDVTTDLFDQLFNERFMSKNLMKSDVLENEDEYKIFIEIPGVKKEDIHLEYKDFNLIVSYSFKNEDAENNNYKVLKRERFVGNYSRSYYMPNIEERNISATYSDGILKIILLKKKNQNGFSIEIK